MAARTKYQVGDPCWADLMSSDIDAARVFYPEVLGWTAGDRNSEFGGYMMFFKDDQPVAGAMSSEPGSDQASAWTPYLSVSNAQEFVTRAENNGATVFMGPQVVGDIGTMAILADPAGATIGLWEPNNFAGFALYDQAGAPAWFEHHSRDYNAAVDFYRSAFNWDIQNISDTDEFRYATAGHDETPFAGIMDSSNFLPEGVAAQWSMYVGVDSVDASCEAVLRLGGTVVDAAADTPYGRIASVADMSGATFRLRQA